MPPGERPVAEVLTGIAGNLQAIARGEAALAIAQAFERARRASLALGMVGVGVVLVVVAFGAALVGAVALLSETMAFWQATSLVGLIALGLGGAVIIGGLARLRRPGETAPALTTLEPTAGHGNGLPHHRAGALRGTGSPGAQRRGARAADPSRG
jgi:Putative Actinobacterial Holin-X, holin superfamily III